MNVIITDMNVMTNESDFDFSAREILANSENPDQTAPRGIRQAFSAS